MSGPDAGRRRERALAAYDVIDGPHRRELDSLVELAAQVAGVPFAAVNLLDSHSQHQVATAGFEGEDSSVDHSMCRLVVESGKPIMLENAGEDVRFAENPWTTGEIAEVKYYGSHPLTTPGGITIGTLCVFDDQTHEVTPEAARGLSQLADRVVDVLELELASRRLGELNDRLATSNDRLAHFAGQVSHDLKNPLTAVSLSLESLELEVTDPFQVDTVARARRGVDRMNGLINNLLEFAQQGEAPGADVVDLDMELSAALDDLAGRVSRDRVKVGPLPLAQGDGSQLRSVLMNLLDNAVKFTLDGEEPEVEVDSHPVDAGNRIEVRDRGRGIPAEKEERVFAPLARLDKSVEGSGIGLATCRRIVEAHGGSMGVEARDGGGTTFWFLLPVVEEP
ncbi:GAF domain-containing sensor histidine kinase [Nocardioides oleivorans]|uniref:Sensor-like histidine kinase SenX3 n=1 Tax=Nocardioides oleivorans TaxID=273676 RepID=A0A4Q2S1G4_9ACTN|nr:GAF domain-containing sensor histidine kinase [Nocardioides oleivorans]RYB95481.1 GAF domain-containing sensor histidine kinase [Nocardioides oleivorans]